MGLRDTVGVVVALAGVTVAGGRPTASCPPGRYLLRGVPVVTRTLPLPVDFVTVSYEDAGHARIGVGSACSGSVRVRVRRNGTALKGLLRNCPGLSAGVRCSATIDPTCGGLTARLKARRVGAVRFAADLSVCGDGVVDRGGGEQCEPPGSQLCDPRCQTVPPTMSDDADMVLVLSATSDTQRDEMTERLRPWVERVQPLSVAFVSLEQVATASGVPTPGAEDVRRYLRWRFTPRPATTDRPRYLGLVGLPYRAYGDPLTPVTVGTIPRYAVRLRGVDPVYANVDTDVPYGFLAPETVDGGDGFLDPGDLDLRVPAFLVFRIPVSQPADLTAIVTKANAFATADYRSDVALVAGTFGVAPGDTALIQCINATRLAETGNARRVVKIFDDATCEPDVLTTPAWRLADVLADPADEFVGGMVYNISHGGSDAIYAAGGPNLTVTDVARLAAGELNVFVSIACANDAPSEFVNLAMRMFLRNSVAVVSATQSLFPLSGPSILDAEVNAFQGLYESRSTLLQGLQRFRSGYYENYVIAGPPEDQPYQWLNLLAVDVVGDGLAVVARGP